ncbi:MAG: hypothetical protein AAGA66_11880, partial [Bacteroidota bacterium]
VEAALAELPIVISDQSGASEVLPNALLSEVGDVDGFVQHLFSIVDKKVDVEGIVSENKNAAMNLKWENTASNVITVFNRFLKQ